MMVPWTPPQSRKVALPLRHQAETFLGPCEMFLFYSETGIEKTEGMFCKLELVISNTIPAFHHHNQHFLSSTSYPR